MTDINDKRDAMANQLLMRGWATMKELLTASFGEWPPKGLDIDDTLQHGQKVNLSLDLLEDCLGKASAFCDDERHIFLSINDFGHGDHLASLHSTLGHEAIHILQGDHAGRPKGPASLLSLTLQSIFGTWRNHTPYSDRLMERLMSKKKNLSDVFKKVLAKGLEKQDAAELDAYLTYLSSGVEMQARLHEMMIDTYARCGRLPATLEELWGAATAAGLIAPAFVDEKLATIDSLSPFSKPCVAPSPVASEMMTACLSLSDEGQKTFWEKTLPLLYADLIEMYGDKAGRARFGFGKNPKNPSKPHRFPGQRTL